MYVLKHVEDGFCTFGLFSQHFSAWHTEKRRGGRQTNKSNAENRHRDFSVAVQNVHVIRH